MRGLKIMLAVIFVVAFASIAMAQTTVTINGGSSFSCNGGYLTLSNIQVDDGVITVNVICNAGNVTPTPTPTPGPTPTPTPTPTPPPSGGGYQGTYLAMNSNPTFDNLGGGQTRLYYFTLPANCGGNGQLRIATNQQQSAPHAAVVVKKTNGSTSTPPPTIADYNSLLTLWGPTNAGTKSQDGIYFTSFNFGSPTGETIIINTAANSKNKTWYTPEWQQYDTYYVLLVNTTSTVTAGWINAYCY